MTRREYADRVRAWGLDLGKQAEALRVAALEVPEVPIDAIPEIPGISPEQVQATFGDEYAPDVGAVIEIAATLGRIAGHALVYASAVENGLIPDGPWTD
jgi:hypothetical protein